MPVGINAQSVTCVDMAVTHVAMRVGLLGAPAMKPAAFVQHPQDFQLHALVGANVPIGDYDSEGQMLRLRVIWVF